MPEYTDKQRIARAFLRESNKSIERYRQIQEEYIRTALAYGLPVEEIERITGREVGDLVDDNR